MALEEPPPTTLTKIKETYFDFPIISGGLAKIWRGKRGLEYGTEVSEVGHTSPGFRKG